MIGRGLQFTEHLRLEPVTAGHTRDLTRLHNDPHVAAWYDGTWSQRHAADWAAGMEQRWEQDGIGKWIAYERATGDLAGRGGLSRIAADSPTTAAITALVGPEWALDRLELGWALTESARGRGLATEIGSAGVQLAFTTLGAHSVVAFTERINTASQAVMRRLGMTYAGEIRKEGWVAGAPRVQPDAPFAVHVIWSGDHP